MIVVGVMTGDSNIKESVGKKMPALPQKKYDYFKNKTPQEGLKEALDYYKVKHKDIVYAQAIHETGHFQSDLCRKDNNLFGLYDSTNKRYYKYSHWSESVKDYKNKVQYKYNPLRHDSYYGFLKDIGYASDREYNNKLRRLVAQWEE